MAHGAGELTIAGMEPFSACDWPGHLSAVVFLQGCPWKCTYCHNVSILDPRAPGQVTWAAVRDLLSARRGLLDAVVFSGGEPTRQAGLVDAARQVRAMGFAVGLHTAGAYPRRLAEVLPHVDWVGLDIKAPVGKYSAVTGLANSADPAFISLQRVLDAGVAVQVRTTLDPMILNADDVEQIRETVTSMGVTDYVVQEVRTDGTSEVFVENLTRFRRAHPVEPLS
ncbi:pyruvate formate lyase activating enzyme [Sanguibacter gelidistatuariae]|uniref:Pyruvate formate lyase activating enzyme n=2 Tax=Sanguibacter gelidistatuariae TaxID=1814289 RepID=A0A1G6HMW7_9MICO|nr:pyruvate formate lyase activating enzyme [Sanguibacter gelidistatuariae]